VEVVLVGFAVETFVVVVTVVGVVRGILVIEFVVGDEVFGELFIRLPVLFLLTAGDPVVGGALIRLVVFCLGIEGDWIGDTEGELVVTGIVAGVILEGKGGQSYSDVGLLGKGGLLYSFLFCDGFPYLVVSFRPITGDAYVPVPEVDMEEAIGVPIEEVTGT
jgi:hypothetical protein